MTELVIHTGMPLTSTGRVRQQLLACREPLDRAGIALVGTEGAVGWDRAVRQVLGGEVPQVLKRIVRRKLEDEFPAILLSSEPAAGALASPTNVMALHTFSRDHDVPVKVVLVVREQLDLLNAQYCRQVLAMETAVGFERFVTDGTADTGLDVGRRFAALLDDSAVELIGVPYSHVDSERPAAAVLAAAGLPGEQAVADPRGAAPDDGATDDRWLPGPVLVTATRLLHKRLTRRGVLRKRSSDDLAVAAAAVRERAIAAGWDREPFWGWTDDLAAVVGQQFAAGNERFAERVWGTQWPDPPPSRRPTRQDLAAAEPAVVSDVMTTIHRLVDDLATVPFKGPAS